MGRGWDGEVGGDGCEVVKTFICSIWVVKTFINMQHMGESSCCVID